MNFSLLSFGFFGLKVYGMLVAFAFAIASWHYYRVLKKERFPLEMFLKNFWKWVVGGVVIGRLFAIFLDWSIIERNGVFSILTFWDGEISFYGAFLGFLGMMWWNCYRDKQSFLRWLDIGVPSFFLALLISDIAGFLTGAQYGRETIMPWGIQYETFGVDILKPTHPVTLYAFALHGVILWWLVQRKVALERSFGKMTFFAGMAFFVADFLLQCFRGDSTIVLAHFFRIEQLFDVLLIGFLLWFFWYLPASKKNHAV